MKNIRKRNKWIAGQVIIAIIFSMITIFPMPVRANTTNTTRYEAENASLSGGAAINTNHSGYSGNGFVDHFQTIGSSAVAFTVSVPDAGTYEIKLRYANAIGRAMSASIYVNGTKARQISLSNLADWDTWEDNIVTLDLVEGSNSITYKVDSNDSGNINLDYIDVISRYEAENASLSSGAAINTNHSGYSGNGFVDGLGNSGATVNFTVYANSAGSRIVNLKYANGYSNSRSISIYVNNAKIEQIFLPSTPNWDTWGYKMVSLNLNSGSNTIAFKYDTGDTGAVNLDYIEVAAYLNPKANSKIATTTYPTDDIVISDYDVTDFGADSTGTIDSTAAIQRALVVCRANGGGTVWMPAGTYKVSSTIEVPPFCQIRGDWRDPDNGSGSYGTVVSANVSSGFVRLFYMSEGSAAVGLTVYYPNQNASNPVDLGWTFDWPNENNNFSSGGIRNITLLNAYKGISISGTTLNNHCNGFYENVKGTALYRGLMVCVACGVDSFSNFNFNNSYWASAGSTYNAPAKSTLDTWTRANGTAYVFIRNECDFFNKLSASDYKYGIWVPSPSAGYMNWGSSYSFCNIQNTDKAIFDEDSGRMMALIRCTLSGSQYSIDNNSNAAYLVTDCSLTGPIDGNVTINSPGTSPASYTGKTSNKVTRAVLYDVTKYPYNAPFTAYNSDGNLPSADATAAIQSALNDAGNAGGGVVYIPAGFYRINTHLTIPANVELRGALNNGKQPRVYGGGTILLAYEGEGTSSSETDTAFITVNGNGSGIRGIDVLYPNNPIVDGQNWKVYPYTFRINGDDVYFVNNNIENGYLGVDISNGSDRHYVKTFLPCCYSKAVNVGTSTEGWIETIHDCGPGPADHVSERYGLTPWYHAENIQILSNSVLVTINGASNEHLLNLYTFGNKSTVLVTSGTADAWNIGGDQSHDYCIKAVGSIVRAMNSLRTLYGTNITYGLTASYNEMHE